MTDRCAGARRPQEITRLIVERMNAGDADGIAALYAPDAVMAFPPGQMTSGRDAIRAVYAGLIENGVRFRPEEPLPTLQLGDLALTSTPARAEAGARVYATGRSISGADLPFAVTRFTCDHSVDDQVADVFRRIQERSH